MKPVWLVSAWLVAASANNAVAQWEDDLHPSGYWKILALAADSPKGVTAQALTLANPTSERHDPQLDLFNRLVVRWRIGLTGDLTLLAQIEADADLGHSAENRSVLFAEPRGSASWLALDATPIKNRHIWVRCAINRLSLKRYLSWGTITLGRQRMAWGSGRVWNPTDLFNPLDPVSIDPGEKRGADALMIDRSWGIVSGLTFAATGGDSVEAMRVAARFRGKRNTYDWFLMGGYFADKWVFGADISGYLGDAGLRMEGTNTDDGDDRSVQLVLSCDYTFVFGGRTLYLLEEAFTHSGGVWGAPQTSDWAAVSTGDRLMVGRLYNHVSGTLQLNPLWSAALITVTNLGDRSVYVSPSLAWAVTQNAEWTAGGQIGFGSAETEYGQLSGTAYLQARWFF